jgi:two-component system response regulator RegA
MNDDAREAETDWKGMTILVVDDDDVFRNQLGRVLGRRGLEVSTADGYDQALEAASEVCPDMATVDLRMPGPGGLELVQDLAEQCQDCDIVVLTGYGSIATAIDAVKLGAINYVQKPVDADDLLAAFERGREGPMEPAEHSYEAPSLARAEWEHINRVLEDCGGNISEAARRLGIHRRTLQRKLNTYPPDS